MLHPLQFAPGVIFVSLVNVSLHNPSSSSSKAFACHLFTCKHNTGDIKLALRLLGGRFQSRTFAQPEPLHPQLEKSSVKGVCEDDAEQFFCKPVFLAVGADALPGVGGDEVNLANNDFRLQ